jgi:hypothetical protein
MIPPAAERIKKPEKGGQIPPFFFDARTAQPTFTDADCFARSDHERPDPPCMSPAQRYFLECGIAVQPNHFDMAH